MDRRDACRLLDVADDVDLPELKRRFRELARDHHPDRGGDPVLFRDLRYAFALLSDELTAEAARPRRPLVSRGRPSRVVDGRSATRGLGVDALDAHGQALADRLTTEGTCRYASRAPGAWTNRFAASLSAASTSSLHVDLTCAPVPDLAVSAQVDLTARTRAARRAVTTLDVALLDGAAWVRQRGDAMTALRTTLRGRSGDDTPIVRRTALAVVELLDALAWPLSEWAFEGSVAPPSSADPRPAR